MQPTVGEIIEGKVTGITKFGAFVSLPDGSNGLVHISEIANTYVNDVHDHVSEGQLVKVKVIGINEAGKINLSIKKAEAPASNNEQERAVSSRPNQPRQKDFPPRQQGFAQKPFNAAPPAEASFEDKLKQFMQDSDSRISDSRIYADKKSSYRRRRD
ncbi:MAG: S1 RNA-binding domain-containing protein [Oscillospiraceae bacterium]|nr:S1 RNA-binding domain-containing protein [Oscillospiraceae bacterium]